MTPKEKRAGLSVAERVSAIALRAYCAFVLFFLVAPLVVIVPLSFNAEPYFTITPAMAALAPEGYSTRWYADILENPQWLEAMRNSLVIGVFATLLATVLGTLAALGLSRADLPWRNAIMGVLLSPLIVPIVIAAAGMYFFFSWVGLAQTTPGLVLAHAALGAPFVVVTVLATLSHFDRNLVRAAASLGADPRTSFFRVTLPLIMPGVISGALFAFITSFDEVVMVLFLGGPDQRTIPLQMWNGIRTQISPTILAVATVLIVISTTLFVVIEFLRRRAARLHGAHAKHVRLS